MSDEQDLPHPDRSPDTAEAPGAAEFAVLEALRAEIRDLIQGFAPARHGREAENHAPPRPSSEKRKASNTPSPNSARDMLGMLADDFSRALAACPPQARDAADPQVKAVLDGVEATDRQLLAALERYGVKPIDTENGKFDPNLHQATFIAEVPGNGKPPGSIVDVVQTGLAHDRRPAAPSRHGDGGAPRRNSPVRRKG